jgi:hypothetical protein
MKQGEDQPRHYVTKTNNMTPNMTLSGIQMGPELN